MPSSPNSTGSPHGTESSASAHGTDSSASPHSAGAGPRGIARYDALIQAASCESPWRHDGAGGRAYLPDLELLGRILTIPVSESASTQTGLLGKGLDAWFAHEFRRAGFNPDAVWPRASDPRVLPTDITALLQRVPADLREDLSARLLKLRAVAPQDASILGRAYTKQVDVVMSSWSTGPELLLSTKSQSSSFGKNLPNRFEEAYGDAGNLRARYPLAAVGFAFVLSSAIHAEPSQLERAIDMMRKLRDRGDGNGYTATCLLMYDASPSGAVSILTDAIPADLGAPQFIDTMITTILDAAPASSHRTVRDRRQGYLLLGE